MMMFFVTSVSIGQELGQMSLQELCAMQEQAVQQEDSLLAQRITVELDSRQSLRNRLTRKEEALATNIANENFEESKKLEDDIKTLKELIARERQLLEEKEIAIFKENYSKVSQIEMELIELREF